MYIERYENSVKAGRHFTNTSLWGPYNEKLQKFTYLFRHIFRLYKRNNLKIVLMSVTTSDIINYTKICSHTIPIMFKLSESNCHCMNVFPFLKATRTQ